MRLQKHQKGIAEDAPHHQFKDIPFNIWNHYTFGFPLLHHESQDIYMDIEIGLILTKEGSYR